MNSSSITTTASRQDRGGHVGTTLVVLVIAHPDDESMFFVPTIFGLQQHQQQHQQPSSSNIVLWLLCLTNGNYDGLGKVREKELTRTATDVLAVHRVILCDDDDDAVRDHPRQRWNVAHVAQLLQTTLQREWQQLSTQQQQVIDKLQIITFDAVGVSGHVNHRDTCAACRHWWRSTYKNHHHHRPDKTAKDPPAQQTRVTGSSSPKEQGVVGLPRNMQLWTLVSDRAPFRYLPIVAWIYLLLTWCGLVARSSARASSSSRSRDGTPRITYRLQYPRLNWRAMASHTSQFVWYRRLFVVFSSYTYVNHLERVSAVPDDATDERMKFVKE